MVQFEYSYSAFSYLVIYLKEIVGDLKGRIYIDQAIEMLQTNQLIQQIEEENRQIESELKELMKKSPRYNQDNPSSFEFTPITFQPGSLSSSLSYMNSYIDYQLHTLSLNDDEFKQNILPQKEKQPEKPTNESPRELQKRAISSLAQRLAGTSKAAQELEKQNLQKNLRINSLYDKINQQQQIISQLKSQKPSQRMQIKQEAINSSLNVNIRKKEKELINKYNIYLQKYRQESKNNQRCFVINQKLLKKVKNQQEIIKNLINDNHNENIQQQYQEKQREVHQLRKIIEKQKFKYQDLQEEFETLNKKHIQLLRQCKMFESKTRELHQSNIVLQGSIEAYFKESEQLFKTNQL